MIFTDLPREELLRRRRPRRSPPVGHRAVRAAGRDASVAERADSRMRRFRQRVRTA